MGSLAKVTREREVRLGLGRGWCFSWGRKSKEGESAAVLDGRVLSWESDCDLLKGTSCAGPAPALTSTSATARGSDSVRLAIEGRSDVDELVFFCSEAGGDLPVRYASSFGEGGSTLLAGGLGARNVGIDCTLPVDMVPFASDGDWMLSVERFAFDFSGPGWGLMAGTCAFAFEVASGTAVVEVRGFDCGDANSALLAERVVFVLIGAEYTLFTDVIVVFDIAERMLLVSLDSLLVEKLAAGELAIEDCVLAVEDLANEGNRSRAEKRLKPLGFARAGSGEAVRGVAAFAASDVLSVSRIRPRRC
jgi:hypothetical protein